MSIALPFLLALLVSASLVPACRAAARRLGYTTSGLRPTPLFGGVAIALTLLGCAAALGAVSAIPVLIVCSTALFLFGLASDLFALKPSTKLVAVIAVASVFLFFDYRLFWTESQTLDALLTLLWIVAVTSAFNLLDNMDGLCGGIALIACTAFVMTLLPVPADGPRLMQVQYLAVLLGAIAGFLVYNVHPASIAMGEAGSLVIGLNMAAMTVGIAPGRGSSLLSVIAVPVLLLLIPILDATLVAASRIAAGPTAESNQDHSSHRLVAMGLSERSAVTLLWALAGMSGLIAVAADRNSQVSGLLAALFTIAMALCAVYVARVRVHEEAEASGPVANLTPLGIQLGHFRRITEVLLDLVLVSVSYYGAHRLLYTTLEWAEVFGAFFRSFPIVLGTQMVALFVVGAYRGLWRYFSLSDGATFAKGVFLGVVTAQAALLYLRPGESPPPPLLIVYGMLLLLLLVGSRASFRLISDFIHRQRQTGKRLLIYGAGDAGAVAVRHLMADPRGTYRVIGFIDDDVGKRNVRVHGYRVIGGYDHLVGMVLAGEVDAVAVAGEGAPAESLAWLCASHGVGVYRLGIDWRQVPAEEARAASLGVALRQAEPRIVPFPEARPQPGGAVPGPRGAVVGLDEARRAGPGPAPAAPVRVAHVITRLILGGAQENTLYTAIGQHLDPRFDVTLVCGIDEAGEGNMFAEARRAGVRAVVLPSLVREIRPYTDVKGFFQLYRFLRRGTFTIVHTHSSKAGILGRLAARAAGVPVVVHTIHGVAFHEFQSAWKNAVYVALERLCAPLSDRIISVSQRLSEAAVARGIGRAGQHTTIFSGIDLDVFLTVRDRLTVEEARRQAGIPADVPVVGKVARLFPLKGHEQFLAAAAAIAREVPGVHFLLVGDGPLRDELQREADALGIGDRLVLVGRVPPEAVGDYMQAMDVVVHTSLREGIARVLPQAGAVGKPVVTFDLDGAPEVIRDGVSGYLVPALDVAAIAERTVELLRDPERRRRFGEAGRAFAAEHFSVERMVARIGALYFELLQQRGLMQKVPARS